MAAWDRRKDESEVEFSRFLAYRNMGPLRSLRGAYHRYVKQFPNAQPSKAQQSTGAPGSWTEDSTRHEWRKRSAAWDRHIVGRFGTKAAVLYIRSLERVAAKVYKALRAKGTVLGGDEWPDIVSGLNLIGRQLSPDVLRGEDDTSDEPDPGHLQPLADPDE